ncbi:hypothetical protein GALMADRAFT_249199 [Galerina marginata CBS 339.88]|uniref:C2H2-type domain-containing protein n=1 Tax=Galerina marginata (strain CBS 339.88) TaxID=685588 RepID=A0A067SYR8_GALM3|nr:hypothetical protein GALMADRAFT_249199 [Galerina marginata CBS 339.88]
MNHNKYPSSAQWNGVATQQYTTNSYVPQNGYHPSVPVDHNSASSQPMPPVYNDPDVQPLQPPYSSNYYTTSTHYPSGSPPPNQPVYSPVSPTVPMNYVHAQGHRPSHHIPRPHSTVPGHYPHSSSNPHSYSHSQTPSSSHSVHSQLSRPRSNSQVYDPSPTNGYAQPSQPHYTEVPIPQTIGISSDYPSSPIRPFSCDLCSLSFNRQHDLKRHRETHTGEKPYLCNGGCGKTFTRKDALKRHQLVKKCGKVDETWS